MRNNSGLTRERWLNELAKWLEFPFANAGYQVPETVRISCSLPSKGAFGEKLRRIGEAWTPKASADNHAEIFISPTISDSILVGATLAHELIHVTVGNDKGHGPVFKKCALAIGLTGKMTATTATPELAQYIQTFVDARGEYPHADLNHLETGRKKQGTRMLKVICTNQDCGHAEETAKPYTVRMSKTTFEMAAPICGCCHTTMILGK